MGSGLIVGSRGQRVLATYFLISSPPCEGAGEGTAFFPNCISFIITNTYRAGMGAARGTKACDGAAITYATCESRIATRRGRSYVRQVEGWRQRPPFFFSPRGPRLTVRQAH